MSQTRPRPSALPDPESPDIHLPAVTRAHETKVRRHFWRKLLRVAGRIPFAREAATACFCATDPATPLRVRATLLAALAYFVTPADVIPDIVVAFGFTDDATVLMAALGLVAGHIREHHRQQAREILNLPPDDLPSPEDLKDKKG